MVSDKDLLAIVEHMPRTRDQLAGVTSLRGAGLRKRAGDILAILGDASVPDAPTHGLIAQPLPRELKPLLASYRQAAERLSQAQGWPQSLVYDRKTLEALASGRLHPGQSGWRQPFIEQLLNEVEQHEHS
ncbi:MAG: hypothetical protein D6758_08685 [Gammaproteobacteria bacterium]|nr:MAG: hypothetical protein D6758_08685 [Gammaproteobacteria bacterium]